VADVPGGGEDQRSKDEPQKLTVRKTKKTARSRLSRQQESNHRGVQPISSPLAVARSRCCVDRPLGSLLAIGLVKNVQGSRSWPLLPEMVIGEQRFDRVSPPLLSLYAMGTHCATQ
jgi:hypothetical protein